MSSPIMTPPPVTPLPPRRHRSFAGPFVLIIIGFVFLLSTMHVLSVGRLAHLFANYWPVLLILWGVIKLLEHMQAQREGARSSGIGAGGVVLIVMVVFFGLIATQLERVNWSGMKDNWNFDDSDFHDIFGGENFNYTDQLEQDFPAGASLKIIDTRGAVSVPELSRELPVPPDGLDTATCEADRQLEVGRADGLRAVCADLVERSVP